MAGGCAVSTSPALTQAAGHWEVAVLAGLLCPRLAADQGKEGWAQREGQQRGEGRGGEQRFWSRGQCSLFTRSLPMAVGAGERLGPEDPKSTQWALVPKLGVTIAAPTRKPIFLWLATPPSPYHTCISLYLTSRLFIIFSFLTHGTWSHSMLLPNTE